ncbi:hypothetical protein [Planctomycetes bacterium Poly30]|uniref:hypothetical protein n=1 Tax=Saltatorellus ferox TaxID=2528018 RepID=UPI0011A99C8D
MNSIRHDLDRSLGDIRRTRELIHEAFLVLLRHTLSTADVGEVPVLALRGGLLGFRAASIVYARPIGLVAPHKIGTNIITSYGDIPDSSCYLLIDTIANTGKTILGCLSAMRDNSERSAIRVAFLFGTQDACDEISASGMSEEVHAGWTDYERGVDHRLIGIDYDAGDYAMLDTSGHRISW